MLKKINFFVESAFPSFGINKKREIVRLIYESAKRENISFDEISKPLLNKKFEPVKNELLKRRYPENYGLHDNSVFYLPKLEINPIYKANIDKLQIYPKNIYIEEEIKNSFMAQRFKEYFPLAAIKIIKSLKLFFKENSFASFNYNKRTDNFFIIREHYDFFKACPCTKNVFACGYNLINLGFGCAFECSYCFLQEYQNFPGIIIPANIEDFFSVFSPPRNKSNLFGCVRIGSGEFTDSLIFDEITLFSKQIIDFFSNYSYVFFEFKTKSTTINNLLNSKPLKNIVVSWSVNPQAIINENEFYTASLIDRITAAEQCSKAGFSVGFHFDPIIYYPGWEKDYAEVVNLIFDKISGESIKWISLGSLRMTPELKKRIENRFPENKILDAELLLGIDKKLRYCDKTRIDIYTKMTNFIKTRNQNTIVYLCMENKNIWRASGYKI